jgi:hypothetical protein
VPNSFTLRIKGSIATVSAVATFATCFNQNKAYSFVPRVSVWGHQCPGKQRCTGGWTKRRRTGGTVPLWGSKEDEAKNQRIIKIMNAFF